MACAVHGLAVPISDLAFFPPQNEFVVPLMVTNQGFISPAAVRTDVLVCEQLLGLLYPSYRVCWESNLQARFIQAPEMLSAKVTQDLRDRSVSQNLSPSALKTTGANTACLQVRVILGGGVRTGFDISTVPASGRFSPVAGSGLDSASS